MNVLYLWQLFNDLNICDKWFVFQNGQTIFIYSPKPIYFSHFIYRFKKKN